MLLRAFNWLRARAIEDCHKIWRFWSVQLTAIGVLLQGWITIAPGSLSALWSQMPGEAKELMPLWLVKGIPIALFVASIAARAAKQRKLEL